MSVPGYFRIGWKMGRCSAREKRRLNVSFCFEMFMRKAMVMSSSGVSAIRS
jgi:hypothetical protein